METMSSPYSASDMLRDYQENGGTFREIEKATGVNRTAISQLANHGMPMPQDKLDKVTAFLRLKAQDRGAALPLRPLLVNRDDQQEAETVPPALTEADADHTEIGLYETEDYQRSIGYCERVYRKRKIGIMVGYPGSGKTTILKEYSRMNPDAHYIECWSSMRMGDLLDTIGQQAGLDLSGSVYKKQQQLVAALRTRSDFMILLDEAEYLKKWNVDKFEALRKIWDNTGTPVILCGTPELISILTRGSGKDNCAQLYRRIYQNKLGGVKPEEATAMMASLPMEEGARQELVKVALDSKHGGLGNFVEVLQICLETAAGDQIDRRMVKDAMRYKLMF